MSRGRAVALAAAAGVLLALSLSGPSLLAFVAYTPLLLVLDRASVRRAIVTGALALSLAALLSVRFAWAPLRLSLSPLLALGVLGAIAAGQALAGAALGALTALGVRFRLGLAASFVGAQLVVEQLPSPLLPWTLALAVHERLDLVQAASLGGAPLVASLVAATSLTAAWPCARALGRRWPRRWAIVPVVSLVAAALAGHARFTSLVSREDQGTSIVVGLVHGDVAPSGRAPVAGLAALTEAHRDGERAGAELVIWPETTLPFALRPDALLDDIRAQLDPLPRVPTVLGALVEAPGREPLNTALLLDHERVVGRHDKRVRMPFGEYTPLASWFPWLDTLSPLAPRAAAAEPITPTALAGHRVACAICYEGVVPGATSDEVARQDADLVINLANDGWFEPTTEPWLHLGLVRLRAVESGRPWLRAANRGVSTALTPSGRALAMTSGPPTRASVIRTPLHASPTPFSRLGSLGAWLGLLPVLVALRGRRTTPL